MLYFYYFLIAMNLLSIGINLRTMSLLPNDKDHQIKMALVNCIPMTALFFCGLGLKGLL